MAVNVGGEKDISELNTNCEISSNLDSEASLNKEITNRGLDSDGIKQPSLKFDFSNGNESDSTYNVVNDGLSSAFDFSLNIRQDARGKQLIDRKSKNKWNSRKMAEVQELKKRGLVLGKKQKTNFKRTFKSKVLLKKVSLVKRNDRYSTLKDKCGDGGYQDEDYGLTTEGFLSDEENLFEKRGQYVRSSVEEIAPMEQFDYLNSSYWLN